MNRLLCAGLLACFILTIAYGQDEPTFSRTLTGYVKDREGQPIAKAKVCAQPHSDWKGFIQCSRSKPDGSFKLKFWRPGRYGISAEHKAAGFPETHTGFYGYFFGTPPVVTVDETTTLEPIEVIIGPKAGRLRLNIVDDESGQPIKSGLIKVCRVDDPNMCINTSTGFPKGRYELLAPEVAFTLKLEVWGSGQEWEARDAVTDGGELIELLNIGLGERKELNIRLRRVPANK